MASVVRGAARVVVRAAKQSSAPVVAVRGLANKAPEQGSIPDIEGLAGRARKEAMVQRAFGTELYEREATAAMEEGTRENPIPILSVESERIVGVSLPDDAEIRWFTLKKGELAYDPDTCNWFALRQVTAEEVENWVKSAEKQALGGKQ